MTVIKKYRKRYDTEDPGENIKIACYAVATYTSILHTVCICYALAVMDRDEHNEFFKYYFTLSPKTAYIVRTSTVLLSFASIGVCTMIVSAIKTGKRYMFLPFIICMIIELLMMLPFGVYLIYRSCIGTYSGVTTSYFWCANGLHLICIAITIAQYQIQKYQVPPRYYILQA